MTPVHAIIIVLVRIWAAETFVSAVAQMPWWVSTTMGANSLEAAEKSFYYFSLIAHVIWFIVALLAWFCAPLLAKRVLKQIPSASLTVSIDTDTLVAIGSFLIGAFVLVRHVPTVLSEFGYYFVLKLGNDPSLDPDAKFFDSELEIFTFVANAIIVLAGLWMVLRPFSLARIFGAMRYAGLAKVDIEKEADAEN